MLSVVDVLRAGIAAGRQQVRLVVPLALAEACAALVGLVPGLWLALRVLLASSHVAAPHPLGALGLGALETLVDPRTWAIYLLGALLAVAAGWLLRTVVQAGTLRVLSAQVGRPRPVAVEALSAAVLEDPARWLAARGLAAVLEGVALGSALGMVVLAMAYFTAHPGPVAALLMTVATVLLISLPLVDAALGLGFARAAILDEGPAEALGRGLELAWRRSSALLPSWYALALAELVVTVSAGGAAATVGALPQGHGGWVLRLAPRALVFLVAAAAQALVALARAGIYATLVVEDAGGLPVAPAPGPAPEPVLEAVAVAEPVFEAVALSPPAEEPPALPPSADDRTPPKA